MLLSKYDMDRPHDEILKRALPYLIFPPKEFRDMLAEQLDSLCQYYRDKNDMAYPDRYKHINEVLDCASFDESTALKIHYFEYDQYTVHESLRRIEQRLFRLENSSKPKQKRGTEEMTAPLISSNGDMNNPVEAVVGPESHGTASLLPSNGDNDNIVKAAVEPKVDGAASLASTEHPKEKPHAILSKYLKSLNRPVSFVEIIEGTGLTKVQVRNTMQHMKGDISTDSVVGPGKYRDTIRNRKIALYSWVGEK